MNAERARGPTNPVCDSQSQLRAIDEWRRRQPDLTLAIPGDPAAHYPRAAEHTAVSRDPGGEGVIPHHPVFNLWPTVRFLFLAACVVWIVFFAVSDSSDPTVPATTAVPVLVGADGRPVTGFGVPVTAPAKPAAHHLVYSIACRTTEDFGKLTELFLVNDRKATARWLGDALRAGTCRRFVAGTVVYKTWAAIPTGLSKFHAKGDPTEWWGIIDGPPLNIYASAALS